MNRNNIWIHITLAVVLIAFAAVVGQIGRWRAALSQQSESVITRGSGTTLAPDRNRPEVLVRFKPGMDQNQARAIAAANNDVLVDEIESIRGLVTIDDLDNADAKTVAALYTAMPGVEYAEPNFEIKLDEQFLKHPLAQDLLLREEKLVIDRKSGPQHKRALEPMIPNDPMFIDQWALNNLGASGGTNRADVDAIEAWSKTTGSEDVVVAVLDSGVDYNHKDLVNNIWQRPASIKAYSDDELGTFADVHGYDATNADGRSHVGKGNGVLMSDPMDENGHGTHCAGIIGAEGNNGFGIAGINWKVKIMPLKFLDRNGVGDVEDAIEAINYVIDRKKAGVNIRVISGSFGSNQFSQGLKDAIKAAGDEGILFVAAAGNDGTNNDSLPHYPSNYDLPNVVSVAALDRNDRITSFSNFGSGSVHIAAPGKDILSTWLGGGFKSISGTSMATPYVSGVAALIVSQNPRISVTDLRKRLMSSVDKLDGLGGKVESGGRICADKATE
ncbi:MAG TPA: S8 family serine peptidase [Pyrinomonadaceae bacterium]|nr:S8 family serine peptidase [Pyrinomonadaceae bacterium]